MKHSRRGDALVLGLVALGLIGVAAVAVPKIRAYMEQSARASIVKNALVNAETRLKLSLLDSLSFATSGCGAGGSLCLKSDLKSIQPISIIGAQCVSGAACGLQIVARDAAKGFVHLQDTTRAYKATAPLSNLYVLDAEIRYLGQEVKVKPVLTGEVVIGDQVVSEALGLPGSGGGGAGAAYTCPVTSPIFRGLSTAANGAVSKVCTAFIRCQNGQFASEIDPVSLKPTCKALPSFNCGANRFITRLLVKDGMVVDVVCSNRLNPYTRLPTP